MHRGIGAGSAVAVAALLVVACGGPEGQDTSVEGGREASNTGPCYPQGCNLTWPPGPLTFPVTYQRTIFGMTPGCSATSSCYSYVLWSAVPGSTANPTACSTPYLPGNPYPWPPDYTGASMTCEQIGEHLRGLYASLNGTAPSAYTVTTTEWTQLCNYCTGPGLCCYPKTATGGYGGSSSGGYGGSATCVGAPTYVPIPQPSPRCTVNVQPVIVPAPAAE